MIAFDLGPAEGMDAVIAAAVRLVTHGSMWLK
jgi:hypothetical protein